MRELIGWPAFGEQMDIRESGESTTIRRRLICRGVVQGVGFRPVVWRVATSLGLGGWVRNDSAGATVEIEGECEPVEAFAKRLRGSLPPLARLDRVEVSALEPQQESRFHVGDSDEGPREHSLIPPDSAPCESCRSEIDDPADRRYRYAFTTCTDCGPRFSLVMALPYDRERTSMGRFALCPECAEEYADPAGRRFHAEPICCPACGPRLVLFDREGTPLTEGVKALEQAREALANGELVAVKGLGGYQLACRADREASVRRLRERKRRLYKPLAIMVRDLSTARALVKLTREDEALLLSPRSPIVLAPANEPGTVTGSVAPGMNDLGVMLATTPLHVELFRDAPYLALVMTSGNASDEPICCTEDDAFARLSSIADYLLAHDREVVRRVDDSVARSSSHGPFLIRRSRGWVPGRMPVPEPAPEPVLALGGYLQTTACLVRGDEAFPSQHVGDLDTELARAFLGEVASGLERFMETDAKVLAADLHPDYPSTRLAEELASERDGRVIFVQHHLAHAAAVLAENRSFPRPGETAAALILDGTGFGPDGVAWGCELLVVDGDLRWRRLAHGASLPLVGGERAVLEPWRVAVAALTEAGRAELLQRTPLARLPGRERVDALQRIVATGEWPRATGAGRVFEAAGVLLGLGPDNRWEGGCAARLEALAARAPRAGVPWPELAADTESEIATIGLLVALAERIASGAPLAELAADFHASFSSLATAAVRCAVPPGTTVALGGGCFVNRLLREHLDGELRAAGYEPLLASQLPSGDGGLSYGQAILGTLSLSRCSEPTLEES